MANYPRCPQCGAAGNIGDYSPPCRCVYYRKAKPLPTLGKAEQAAKTGITLLPVPGVPSEVLQAIRDAREAIQKQFSLHYDIEQDRIVPLLRVGEDPVPVTALAIDTFVNLGALAREIAA